MDIQLARPRSESFQLGQMNKLPILRLVSIGAYLRGDETTDILLPIKYLPEGAEVGDEVEVFIYHDNEGRLIATTLRPFAFVGQTAYLECVSLSASGAFLAWGIHKDLLVPFREQQQQMQEGRYYAVHLYLDRVSGKIVGSAKLNKHIGNTLPTYRPNAEVEVLVVEQNEVGYRCVVDHIHWGILYHNELSQSLSYGEKLTAYVKRVREDGRLDLNINPVGYDKVGEQAQRLLRLLKQNGGRLDIGDKSDAERVQILTGMSKKTFKMAVGLLYKERRIEIAPERITLIR